MCFLKMLGSDYECGQDGHQEMTLRDGATTWGKPGDAFRIAVGFFFTLHPPAQPLDRS